MARSTTVPRPQPTRDNRDAGDYDYQDEQGEHWGGRLLIEVLEVAVLTLVIFLVVRLLVQNYQVDGPSMQPTLYTSEYILVNKVDYYVGSPQRGDVIVFHYPLKPSVDYVKRVIGLPGDTVTVDASGMVTVDGVQLNEPYVNDHDNPYRPQTWQLSANQYFVLGDNRGDSSDSRDWGPVPRFDIVGKADLVYWPLNDVHLLRDWSGIFRKIHP